MSSGGSEQHRPTRKRLPRQSSGDSILKAISRAKVKVGGEATFQDIKSSWDGLKTGNHQEDQEKGNGIIINLLNLGLSQHEIVNLLKCSASRIGRMRERIRLGELYVKPDQKPPSHAFTEKTTQFLYNHMDTWEARLEQGFPCPHLRMKHYFVHDNDAPKVTWSLLHQSRSALRIQHLINTPIEECVHYVMTANPAVAARELKDAIFGAQNIDNLDPRQLRLPRCFNIFGMMMYNKRDLWYLSSVY